MKTIVYSLFDSFNQRHLSSHKTLANALKARQRYAKKWARLNGVDAYLHYKIIKSDDTSITRDELIEAEISAGVY
jgi:hypothetical protein